MQILVARFFLGKRVLQPESPSDQEALSHYDGYQDDNPRQGAKIGPMRSSGEGGKQERRHESYDLGNAMERLRCVEIILGENMVEAVGLFGNLEKSARADRANTVKTK